MPEGVCGMPTTASEWKQDAGLKQHFGRCDRIIATRRSFDADSLRPLLSQLPKRLAHQEGDVSITPHRVRVEAYSRGVRYSKVSLEHYPKSTAASSP
jgi:hypothetical protein